MTRYNFRIAFVAVIVLYVVLVVMALAIRVRWPDADDGAVSWQYSTYKDILPLLVAIPAAWLAFCVQRRLSYMQQLRTLWSKLVEAVQSAVEYTHLPAPQAEDQKKTLRAVSTMIDEVRAVFKNLGESRRHRGMYPFGGVKGIHDEIRKLKWDAFTPEKATAARDTILAIWSRCRDCCYTNLTVRNQLVTTYHS